MMLAMMAGGMYFALETDPGRDAVSSIMSSIQGDATTLVSTGGEEAGYANHAHHEVEKLRQAQGERYRYGQQMAEKLGAIPADPTAAPKLVGAHVSDLREVLRFDITPRWVIDRFARVTTVLADVHLEGLRVPIVTGTRPDDIAGTLTYYFDAADKLQRITIHGFTGDANRVVTTMTQFYGLGREPSLEAGVYTKRWNGEPVHFLRITHAPVVYSDAVHQKYTVFLELNEPNIPYGISLEARRIVTSDRGSGRW